MEISGQLKAPTVLSSGKEPPLPFRQESEIMTVTCSDKLFHKAMPPLKNYIACWPLVPKFVGSNPAEAVGFFQCEKILSTPSFGGEVKPFVPCRRFTACKRSLMLRGSRAFSDKIHRPFLAQVVPPFTTRGLWWRHLAVQV